MRRIRRYWSAKKILQNGEYVFRRFPTKPTQMTIVRVGNDLFGRGKTNTVYSLSGFPRQRSRYASHFDRAMNLLGVISRETLEKREAARKKAQEIEAAREAIGHVGKVFKRAGIELTPEQLRGLRELAKDGAPEVVREVYDHTIYQF